MFRWLFLSLILQILSTAMSDPSSCGGLNFRRHERLDDVLFTEALVAEDVAEGTFLCSERCYRHPICNMLLYNPASQRCRLYKSSGNAGVIVDTGWQYYAVDCQEFRLENAVSLSVLNQSVSVLCNSGFSYFPSPPMFCHLDTGVMKTGMCVQTRWINQPTPFSADLPAPLPSGAEIIVRWSGSGENVSIVHLNRGVSYVFFFTIRWFSSQAIYNTKSLGGLWGAEIHAPTFVFTPHVVFDFRVRITATHFLIFIDGAVFLLVPIREPVEDALTLSIDADHLESVEMKYP